VLESPVDGVTVATGSGLDQEEHDKLLAIPLLGQQIATIKGL